MEYKKLNIWLCCCEIGKFICPQICL